MRLSINARESKSEQNEVKNSIDSVLLYKEKLGVVLADIIVLFRQIGEPGAYAIEIMRKQLPYSAMELFEWCLQEHDSIKPHTDTYRSPNYDSIYLPEYESTLVEKRKTVSADPLLIHLQQMDVIQRLAVPLLSIIQKYAGDDLEEALKLFSFLVEQPILQRAIDDIKKRGVRELAENYFNRFRGFSPYRDLSILGKCNQNDVSLFLINFFLRNGYLDSGLERIIRIQGFSVTADVLCQAIHPRGLGKWFNYGGQHFSVIKFLFERISDKSNLACIHTVGRLNFLPYIHPVGWLNLPTNNDWDFIQLMSSRPDCLGPSQYYREKWDTRFQSSALILAIETRDLEVSDFLLEDQRVRAEINAVDSNGMTALAIATKKLNSEKVRRLLMAKADPTIKINGETLIKIANKNTFQIHTTSYEDQKKVLNMLEQAIRKHQFQQQRQKYVSQQFGLIKEQKADYSYSQKRICREYFTNRFAECRTYSEIIKAYQEHNNASYTNQDRWPMFRRSPFSSTKTHLLTVALEAIIRMAKRYIMPSDDEINQLNPIIKQVQVDKHLEPLIKEISTLIPKLKVDKTESPTPGSSAIVTETYCQLP